VRAARLRRVSRVTAASRGVAGDENPSVALSTDELTKEYAKRFGGRPTWLASAAGRVNLLVCQPSQGTALTRL
jgi:hypothetical protein